jgi:hypothetical protein
MSGLFSRYQSQIAEIYFEQSHALLKILAAIKKLKR